MEKNELISKIESLGINDESQRNKVVCALIGHSKIVSMCFGYVYCGRCDEQIGDTLAGGFDASKCVVIGHNCKTCRENYKNLTWEDTIYCKQPFHENVKDVQT
ncbi:MAG: hypothetical protein HPY90_05600 [Syntrophothermus sp.]|uniref:hypothetical protein n=1 Tax=Syntrophothermus sp. TaxID=2736299 RepID=UPI00257D1837|nr:hypothetical protein [Syntrophothermus sp.]NSW82739.1 hypothetical protein [Syntrophothermus sp.]